MKAYRWSNETLPGAMALDGSRRVALRFRLAEFFAQMGYGDEVLVEDDVVGLCWPPTGDHDHSIEGAFRAMALSNGGLRPETSLTSIERIEGDLPTDGSYVAKLNLVPPGVMVIRRLDRCPRCRGRGIEQYHEPEQTSLAPLRADAVLGTTVSRVMTRVCDHKLR